MADRLSVLLLQFLQYVQRLQLLVWWILELHIIKIVSAYIIWVSVKEVRRGKCDYGGWEGEVIAGHNMSVYRSLL